MSRKTCEPSRNVLYIKLSRAFKMRALRRPQHNQLFTAFVCEFRRVIEPQEPPEASLATKSIFCH